MGIISNYGTQAKKTGTRSFEAYTDDLYDPVIVVDNTMKIRYYNNAFVSLIKSSPRRLAKVKNLSEVIECPFLADRNFARCISEKSNIFSNEVKLKAGESEFDVLVRMIPIISSGIVLEVLLVIHDVSIEKRLHDKYRVQLTTLKDATAQMTHTDRLALLGKISAEVAHELGGPTSLIMGYADLLKEELRGNSPDLQVAVNHVKQITESCLKANKIIDEVKNYSHRKDDSLSVEPFDKVIQHAINLYNPTFKKFNIQISQVISPGNYLCVCNRPKIEQVFFNLFSNAKAAIEQAALPLGEGMVTIEMKQNDQNQLIINIKDNGTGIKSADAEHIFEPFFTTKEMGEGTGLGLSIVENIIRWHKGTIKFVPSVKGANFEIMIPCLDQDQKPNPNNSDLMDDDEAKHPQTMSA